MKNNNRILIAALLVGLILVLLTGAMICFINCSSSVRPTDNSVSINEEGNDSVTESGTLPTNPNDDGFGTEVSM